MPLHLQLRTRFRIKRPKAITMEKGETSASNSSIDDDVWAKLVPLNSSYPDIELRLNEESICLDIKTSPCEKQVWCQITREKDRNSALMRNKCCSSILVDGAVVREDDTTTIRCGSKMTLGPVADGFLRYVFIVMPAKEMCREQLKITLDPDCAKCPICLNVWHDVVTVAPCLHNFCNGCFSEWLKRCQQRRSSVRCPQCRAKVQFVARNHFLHNMEEDILQYDSSLRHSDAELVLLESCSSIKSPLCLAGVDSLSDEEAFSDYEEEHDVPDPVPAFDHAAFEQRLHQYVDDRFDRLRAELTQIFEARRREMREYVDDNIASLRAEVTQMREAQQRQSEELCRWNEELCRWKEELCCWKEEQRRRNEEQSRRNEDCMKMMQDFEARVSRHPPPPPT